MTALDKAFGRDSVVTRQREPVLEQWRLSKRHVIWCCQTSSSMTALKNTNQLEHAIGLDCHLLSSMQSDLAFCQLTMARWWRSSKRARQFGFWTEKQASVVRYWCHQETTWILATHDDRFPLSTNSTSRLSNGGCVGVSQLFISTTRDCSH